jgi:hypothetical protein
MAVAKNADTDGAEQRGRGQLDRHRQSREQAAHQERSRGQSLVPEQRIDGGQRRIGGNGVIVERVRECRDERPEARRGERE